MLKNFTFTPSEIKTIRYALDQHILTLKEDVARLSDPRMNGAHVTLVAEFTRLQKEMQAVLDRLPEY